MARTSPALRCLDCGGATATVSELRAHAMTFRRAGLSRVADFLEQSARLGHDPVRGVTRHYRQPQGLVLCNSPDARPEEEHVHRLEVAADDSAAAPIGS